MKNPYRRKGSSLASLLLSLTLFWVAVEPSKALTSDSFHPELNHPLSTLPLGKKAQPTAGPVRGKVIDEEGNGLPGVNVIIKGTAKGVTTDTEGDFAIDINQGETLVFSYIGYVSQEKEVSSTSSFIDVVLTQSTTTLTELVVMGYGVQEKRDISGSVATLKGDAIENMPVQSLDRALQGRAAGVQVYGSGIPGGEVNVRIRGRGSIKAGNSPLYIVDGIQMTSTKSSRLIASSNPLNSINPNDIASIDVLKDAAAASIYGAQGANGVVIITTKRGQSGQTRFNFNTSIGVMSRLKKQEVLTGPEFVGLTLEAYRNRYGENSSQYRAILKQLGPPESAPTYDWQDAVFRKGMVNNYELSATGGKDKTTFYLAGSYNQSEAHVVGTRYKRGNLRVNLDHEASERLKISPTINLGRVFQRVPIQEGNFSNPNRSSHLIAPINPIYLEDGSFNPSEYGGGEPFFGAYSVNVVRDAQLNETTATTTSINGGLAASYKISKSLTFKSTFGLDYVDILENQWFDPRTSNGNANNGEARVLSTKITNWQTDQVLTYERMLDDRHQFDALLGVFYRQSEEEASNAEAQGFPSYKLKTLQNAATPSKVDSYSTIFKTAGIFGKVNYILDDKYIFSATLRRDGHSRFGANRRYGTFPAVSAAWRISEESFMPELSWLDDLKGRLSYGVTGNSEINNFDARGIFSTGGEYNGESGLEPRRIANPDLTWEENETVNAGLDLSIFNGRLNFTADGYVKTNKKLLLDRPLPRTTGFEEITVNAGTIRNKGIEFELYTTNVVVGQFQWSTNTNLSLQKSKVMALPDFIGDTLVISNYGEWYVVGQPAFAFYLQHFAGVNAADGRPFWLDKDGNPTYRRTSGNARMFQGVATPKWSGGVTNTFTYKSWELSTLFQFQGGHVINNTERSYAERAGSTADRNQNRTQLDRWQRPGDVTDVAIAVLGFAYPNGGASRFNVGNDSRNLEKGDYLRLKQVQLSYILPHEWLNKIGLQSVKLYGQAVNYWTLTAYRGFDPEFIGEDFGDLPQPKTLIFGLQASF